MTDTNNLTDKVGETEQLSNVVTCVTYSEHGISIHHVRQFSDEFLYALPSGREYDKFR